MITLLYASLLGLLQVTLAYKVGSSRLKTNTLLGDGNQSEVLQKVRAHGNLTEYVPIFLILLALIEFTIVSAITSCPIKSPKIFGLYFNARTLELLFIFFS